MEFEPVKAALNLLENDGARAFDAPACDCIRTLLAQAERLGGAVAERLLARAEVHLGWLSERFASERARVRAELVRLETQREEALPELQQQLVHGEVARVARALRRLRHRPPRPATSVALANVVPHPQTATDGHSISARQRKALSYEDSVAELLASFALARAVDMVPEGAGPYNALRIASAALDQMRAISPFYLTVQLNRLEELASLLSLPESPIPEPASTPAALPKKKRRAPKGKA